MDIETLLAEAQQQLEGVTEQAALEQLRVHYLGKKGLLTALLKTLGSLSPEERKVQGQRLNAAKEAITAQIEAKGFSFESQRLDQRLKTEGVDITLPGRLGTIGSRHPITKTRLRIEAYFSQLGFDIETGSDIETDHYNFEALNMPAHHPARAMQDTFYMPDKTHVLRTHTSPVQIHYMEQHEPPFRMIAPGRVYRADSDVTHTPMFHQIEGLVVDTNVSMAHLKTVLQDFLQAFFEMDCQLRFRASYFPFTEPSAEVDVSCVACRGLKTGCRVCKESGWLEVLGCGMVHPNVLKAGGIDPERYRGFAFGIGLERLTMLRYQVSDIRHYFENDLRFLDQFSGA